MKTIGTIAMLLLLCIAVACGTASQGTNDQQPTPTVGGYQTGPTEQVRDYHNYLEY